MRYEKSAFFAVESLVAFSLLSRFVRLGLFSVFFIKLNYKTLLRWSHKWFQCLSRWSTGNSTFSRLECWKIDQEPIWCIDRQFQWFYFSGAKKIKWNRQTLIDHRKWIFHFHLSPVHRKQSIIARYAARHVQVKEPACVRFKGLPSCSHSLFFFIFISKFK